MLALGPSLRGRAPRHGREDGNASRRYRAPFDKLRVGRQLERFAAMGLQTEGLPDPRNRPLREAADLGHAACAPLGRHRRRRLSVRVITSTTAVIRDFTGRPGARLIGQSLGPPHPEAFPPLADAVLGYVQPLRHRSVGQALGARQDHARSLCQTLGRRGASRPLAAACGAPRRSAAAVSCVAVSACAQSYQARSKVQGFFQRHDTRRQLVTIAISNRVIWSMITMHWPHIMIGRIVVRSYLRTTVLKNLHGPPQSLEVVKNQRRRDRQLIGCISHVQNARIELLQELPDRSADTACSLFFELSTRRIPCASNVARVSAIAPFERRTNRGWNGASPSRRDNSDNLRGGLPDGSSRAREPA